MNVKLINETLDYIEAHPKKWSQETYHTYNGKRCFIGIALFLSGVEDERTYNAALGSQVLDITWRQATRISHTFNIRDINRLRDHVSNVLGVDFR